MKKKEYTREQLLDVLGSYLCMINRSGDEFPTVVLSDIKASCKTVLKANSYNGRYAGHLNEDSVEAKKENKI